PLTVQDRTVRGTFSCDSGFLDLHHYCGQGPHSALDRHLDCLLALLASCCLSSASNPTPGSATTLAVRRWPARDNRRARSAGRAGFICDPRGRGRTAMSAPQGTTASSTETRDSGSDRTKEPASNYPTFRFSYTGIRVRDMAESIRFYTEVLRMEIVDPLQSTPQTKGQVVILRSRGSSQLLEL